MTPKEVEKAASAWKSYLLPAQLVVHLYPLHLLQALLQPLVALPQLPDVVAGFGQDASLALQGHGCLQSLRGGGKRGGGQKIV